ncbi:MAG: tail fiber domain-containing protein [Bacteroidales bacterium]
MKTGLNHSPKSSGKPRILSVIITGLFLLSYPLFAQAPHLLGYQAVVRDAAGNPLAETEVTLRLGIHSETPGGLLLWQEDHNLLTGPQGLVSVQIGQTEKRTGGSLAEFAHIEWGTAPHFLQVQVNTGSGFTELGTTELVSVPYALYAREAGTTPLSDIWSAQGENISTPFSVGIGTETPAGKLEVLGNPGAQDDDPLFEVKRNDGQPVFSVYNEGVRIWVQDDWVKGTKGGFAVGGFNPAKGETNEFLRVTPDSVRIYVENPQGKASKGGFAVGGFTPAKTNAEPLMQLTRDNYLIGHQSGRNLEGGLNNILIGYQAGYSVKEGSNNIFIGQHAGLSNNGSGNIFLGPEAGRGETGSDKLYIDNSESDPTKTLVWGDFNMDLLRFNAFVGVLKEPVEGIAMDINGNLRISEELITGSDIRFKTSVEPLDHALDQVSLLQGVRYEWNREDFPGKHFSEGKHIGLIAQDVEQVVPELVETGADGYKAVNYNKLPALLVEAVKEQQAQIEAQAERISMLEALVEKLMEEK